MRESVLVVAAHPDDETLGCGGTMARLAAEGARVSVLILGKGGGARYDKQEQAPAGVMDSLESGARAACAVLGAADVRILDFPDNRFDTVPLLDIVKRIEEAVRELGPVTVYTHSPCDLNIDHRIAFEAVITATRPVADCGVRDVYSFEIPSSTEWAFGQLARPFQPNVYVDVADYLPLKQQAMQEYGSELGRYPHPRSPEALEALARRRGSEVGFEAAEAFVLVRSLR